ncbi:MAG: tetratricopeptide repeat protein, partial [Firmicutes bacterium]|nr:tetratricopeptide repeat protein [Candidatus Scybalomonas excrementavium]
KIKELLEEYETIASKNSIHEQYIDYIYGILSWKYGRQEEALRWLEKSIQCTMPDGFQPEGLIGTEEIKLLILFEKLNYEHGEKTKKKRKRYILFLQNIKKYVGEKIEDQEGKASIYPRITLDLVRFEIQRKQYESARRLCEESIELLTNHFMLQGLLEHIELLKEIYEHINVDEQRKFKLSQIHKVLSDFYVLDRKQRKGFMILESNKKNISLDWEVIKGIRNAYQISQEKLADDIYTQESISRIESQKRKVNHKKLEELKNKFGIHLEIYDSVLKTTDFKVLDLERKMTLHCKRREWSEAEELLERIKGTKLERDVINQQFFKYHRALLQYNKKEIKGYELKKQLREALFLTKPKEMDIFKGHLTNQEFYIINCLGLAEYEMGRSDAAAGIWKNLFKYYKSSQVDFIFHYENVSLILSNLAKVLEEMGNIDEAETLCEKAIQLSKRSGNGEVIGRFLNLKGWILEHYKGEKEKACLYYKQAFWFFILFKQYEYSEIVREYYKKISGSDLISL